MRQECWQLRRWRHSSAKAEKTDVSGSGIGGFAKVPLSFVTGHDFSRAKSDPKRRQMNIRFAFGPWRRSSKRQVVAGAKAQLRSGLFGTTEVVPCPKQIGL